MGPQPCIYWVAECRWRSAKKRNVSAVKEIELPTPEEDPDGTLRRLIETVMMYGPYGGDNRAAPCMASP